MLADNNELDRQKMAAIVFKDPSKRRQLESILHPRIRERYQHVLEALEQAGHAVAVYEVPLLFEKNLEGDMKGVILVCASEQARINRVRARDRSTEEDIRARMAAQMDEETKRKRAQYIIDNDGTLDDLRREVEYLLSRYLKLPGTVAPDDSPQSKKATEIPQGPAWTPPPAPGGDGPAKMVAGVPKPQSETVTLPPERAKNVEEPTLTPPAPMSTSPATANAQPAPPEAAPKAEKPKPASATVPAAGKPAAARLPPPPSPRPPKGDTPAK